MLFLFKNINFIIFVKNKFEKLIRGKSWKVIL